MKLLIGLGNPGEEYGNTRHNIGFQIITLLFEKYGINDFENKFDGRLAKAKVKNVDALLFMPMTYMNNSGIPALKIKNFYKIDLQDIYVIHDDLDLELGRIKVKKGGGNAGHNGLKSLDACLGKEYSRVRIGIGRPEHQGVSNYVLSKFSKDEFTPLEKKICILTKKFNFLLENNLEQFYGFINKH